MLIGIIQVNLFIMHNKGIIYVDPETGLKYYVDPISMIISKFQESKSNIFPVYYKTL
jgi:hypothetical protein